MALSIPIPYKFDPREYQLPKMRALDDGFLRGVSIWHRRAGKDKTDLNIMIKKACERVGLYFYLYPEYAQARKAIWDGIDGDGMPFMDHIPQELRSRTRDQEMQVILRNGSIIQLVGSDRIDKVMGTNPIGCVFSEFSLQNPDAWEFVRPILAENGGWALFNFTPRGLNHAHDLWRMAVGNPNWFSELLTVEDTKRPDGSPVVSQERIQADRDEGMSEAMIQQEYYCSFNASQADKLIALDLIQRAAGKIIHPAVYMRSPKIMGVDVARFGDDKSALITRQGLATYNLIRLKGKDNFQVAQRVANELKAATKADASYDAVFIDLGRGEGVIDSLRHMWGYEVTGINFGGKASDQAEYHNKRSEMYDLTEKWLANGGAIPDDLELRTDLSTPTYSFDNQDRLKLQSKEDMKKEFGRSPDSSDALVLTFAVPVVPKAFRKERQPEQATTNYDILKHNRPVIKQNQSAYDFMRHSR